MTDATPDLDDLLRRANPVEDARLPAPVDHAPAQLLYEHITGTPYAGAPKPSRRTFGTLMAAVAALGLVGGGVAYAGLRPSKVRAHLSVACYAQDSLDGRVATVTATADGPVAACANAWALGGVGTGPVPLLAACVAPSGVASVFPSAAGANVCAQLGLAPLPAAAGGAPTTAAPGALTTSDTVDLLIQVRNGIISSLQGQCLDASTATLTVQHILQAARLPWSVKVPNPFPPDHPCASPAFDEQNDEVLLIGIPRQG
ncbi:MAG TPA: hypothetical protein VFA83_25310 [Acidimicrobiales bacterium]|nr:hypothetical protein [Acidimicrobiales bacterium]